MKRPTASVIALLALVPALLGDTCGGSPAPPEEVTIGFDWGPTNVFLTGATTEVSILADLGGRRLQAFELDVVAIATGPKQRARVLLTNASSHPEYDDDGGLFALPAEDAQGMAIRDIVDFAHGPAEARTWVRLARFDLVAQVDGPMELRLENPKLVDDRGQVIPVRFSPAAFTVSP